MASSTSTLTKLPLLPCTGEYMSRQPWDRVGPLYHLSNNPSISIPLYTTHRYMCEKLTRCLLGLEAHISTFLHRCLDRISFKSQTTDVCVAIFLTHHFQLANSNKKFKLPIWPIFSTFQTWWQDHPKLCSPGPLQAEPQQYQTSAWRGGYQYMGGRSHSRGRTQHCNFQRNHFLSFPRCLIKHFHFITG